MNLKQLAEPSPGIYQSVPFEDYVNWDAVNHSRLDLMRKSPLHYLIGGGESSKSKALDFGHLFHAGILESRQMAVRYAVMPPFEHDAGNIAGKGKNAAPSTSKSTTYYKEKKAEFEAVQRQCHRTIIEQSDYQMLTNMLDAFEENQRAVEYLRGGAKQKEISIVWLDRATGLRCKARIDAVSDGALCDVKTCPEPDPMEFSWAIWKWGYHRQAAWYLDGWNTLADEFGDATCAEFRIVAVGKERPHQCVAAPIDQPSIELGREENTELLAQVVECQKTGKWPGYGNPESWGVPNSKLPDKELVFT